LANTWRMLVSPNSYLVFAFESGRLPVMLRAAWTVLWDFARGQRTPPIQEQRNLLIVRLDRLGDLVATTSILSALKKHDPPWNITLIVAPWCEPIFKNDDRVDHLMIYPTDDTLVNRDVSFTDGGLERRAIRRRLAEAYFDVAIDPTNYPDSTALLYLPRSPRRIVTSGLYWYGHGLAATCPKAENEHELQRLAGIFRVAGFELDPENPEIRLGSITMKDADQKLAALGLKEKKLLLLHPGAGWKGRWWPIQNYLALAERIAAGYGLTPVGIFGRNETELMDVFQSRVQDLNGAILFDLPLDLLLGVMARAKCFIGNDSGLMHAAAALNVPTLAIFGPGNLAHWRPTGARTKVVTLGLACSPCDQFTCTDQRCLTELKVDQVWEAFQDLIRKEPGAGR